jgi:hypothetical protein
MYLLYMDFAYVVYRHSLQVDLHWIQCSKDLLVVRTMARDAHRKNLLAVNRCHGSR